MPTTERDAVHHEQATRELRSACCRAIAVLAAIDDEFSGLNLTYEQGHRGSVLEMLVMLREAVDNATGETAP